MAITRVGLLAADDDVRAGRAQMLNTLRDFRVVFEEPDGLEAIKRLPDATVDLLLVNHRLKTLDGLATIQRLYDELDDVPRIITTGPFASPELTVSAAKVGSLATVTMDAGAAELVSTLRRVRDNDDQKELGKLISAIAEHKAAGGSISLGERDFGSLTDKQRQMIAGYASGQTDAEMLAKLRIVAESQAKQLRSIFDKLKLHTRSQLVLIAPNAVGASNE